MDPVSQAWADFEHDDYTKAEQGFRRILDLPELADEDQQQARYGLGYALTFSQQYEEARSLFLELQQESANRHDPGAQHRALHQVGMVERMAGNWPAAQETFEKERDLIALIGNADLAVAVNAYELGLVALHMGQSDRARAWLDLSLACAERTQDLICVGCAHRGLGDWYHTDSD